MVGPRDCVSPVSADRKPSSSVTLGGSKKSDVNVSDVPARADKKAASSIGSAAVDAGAADVFGVHDELPAVTDGESIVSVDPAAAVEILDGSGVLATVSTDATTSSSAVSSRTSSSSHPPTSLPPTTPSQNAESATLYSAQPTSCPAPSTASRAPVVKSKPRPPRSMTSTSLQPAAPQTRRQLPQSLCVAASMAVTRVRSSSG